jgi:hypothetical protein
MLAKDKKSDYLLNYVQITYPLCCQCHESTVQSIIHGAKNAERSHITWLAGCCRLLCQGDLYSPFVVNAKDKTTVDGIVVLLY